MQRISILGSGWLGQPLANHFNALGYDVNLSTRTPEKLEQLSDKSNLNPHSKITPHLVDIDALGQLDSVVGIEGVDARKAKEAIVSFLESDILIINIPSKNISGFESLVQLIDASRVKKVIFISSTSVYSNMNKPMSELMSESDCVTGGAGKTKSADEKPLITVERLFLSNSTFQTTVIRFAGLVGGKRHPGRFFKPGRIVQQPEACVNLIHLDDCIGLITQVINKKSWGEVFNGCASTHPTKRTFYSHAANLAGLPAPTFSTDDAILNGKTISNEKAKKQLGYTFIHDNLMTMTF